MYLLQIKNWCKQSAFKLSPYVASALSCLRFICPKILIRHDGTFYKIGPGNVWNFAQEAFSETGINYVAFIDLFYLFRSWL